MSLGRSAPPVTWTASSSALGKAIPHTEQQKADDDEDEEEVEEEEGKDEADEEVEDEEGITSIPPPAAAAHSGLMLSPRPLSASELCTAVTC
jgi:hypothetical protein